MSHASLSLVEHRRLVEALGRALPPVRLPLRRALGTVLAEPVVARFPVPPFTNSAMDGFAVRADDLAVIPTTLPVAGDVPAGSRPGRVLARGTALRIMTGAPLPVGADTVVKVEMTDHAPGTHALPEDVTFRQAPPTGANIRRRGEDVEAGTTVLWPTTPLDGAALSAAASVGHAELCAHPLPRVGVVTTGSELAEPGKRLPEGSVPDSNGILLEGLIRAAGARVLARARAADDPSTLLSTLDSWPEVDLIVTAGGISAGAYEVVRQALAVPTMRFHRVAQQPGGPQGIGTMRIAGKDVPIACLPGNPVSVFASFHAHVAGLIAMLAGRASTCAPAVRATVAGVGWSSPPGKVQFVPVVCEREGTVRPVHRLGSGSHLVASLPRADGLAVVASEADAVRAGDRLGFIPTRAEPSAVCRTASAGFPQI